MGNKERARAWRRAQKPWLPRSWEEYASRAREERDSEGITEWFAFLCRCIQPSSPVLNNWLCGQDIEEGQIVYGISRVYAAQPGPMISRYIRGVAAKSGRKGKVIPVQVSGMATIPVEAP